MTADPAAARAPMKLVVVGAAGRMGRALIAAVAGHPDTVLHAAIERPGAAELGMDAGTLAGLGPLDVPVTDDALAAFVGAEGVLDFTVPDATVDFAAIAAQARIVHVIGTTGLKDEHVRAIEAAARHATIVRSGNMSLGVNILADVTRRVARALDADYDIEIVEMHHRHKVDAPSGTALMLGAAAAEGRGVDLDAVSVRARDGITGPRQRGDIGFATLRGGSVIGDHTVIFAADGERLEFSHRAGDRSLFANGALKAALWGRGRKPGHFSMADVLGLSDA